MKINLINEEYGKKFQEHFLEQYKIITKSAEDVTDKRHNVNKYYLGVNSFLLTLAGYLASINLEVVPLIIASIGFITSIIWHRHILSFKSLNSAKFKVILEIEKNLPARIYNVENEYLKKNYYKLTSIETWIPFIFGLLYALIIFIIILISYL